MALNKNTLKASLVNAFQANISHLTATQSTQIDNLCGALADAIDTYVKTATITYTGGLTAPNGPVAGVFGGNLN